MARAEGRRDAGTLGNPTDPSEPKPSPATSSPATSGTCTPSKGPLGPQSPKHRRSSRLCSRGSASGEEGARLVGVPRRDSPVAGSVLGSRERGSSQPRTRCRYPPGCPTARCRLPGESLLGKKRRANTKPHKLCCQERKPSRRSGAPNLGKMRRGLGKDPTRAVARAVAPACVCGGRRGLGLGLGSRSQRSPLRSRPALTLAAAWAKRGCRGAARPPRGEEGGARQAQVPAAPAGSAAERGAPPAPGLHAGERAPGRAGPGANG